MVAGRHLLARLRRLDAGGLVRVRVRVRPRVRIRVRVRALTLTLTLTLTPTLTLTHRGLAALGHRLVRDEHDLGEIWGRYEGDMGRYRVIWGDMARRACRRASPGHVWLQARLQAGLQAG